MGSGFVAEPYDDDPERTLLSYICHVSSYAYSPDSLSTTILLAFCWTRVQVDTKGIPSVINAQVLKRHPMAIHRIKVNLEDRKPRLSGSNLPSISSSSSSPPDSPEFNQSSYRFEEDLQVRTFTGDKSLP